MYTKRIVNHNRRHPLIAYNIISYMYIYNIIMVNIVFTFDALIFPIITNNKLLITLSFILLIIYCVRCTVKSTVNVL